MFIELMIKTSWLWGIPVVGLIIYGIYERKATNE